LRTSFNKTKAYRIPKDYHILSLNHYHDTVNKLVWYIHITPELEMLHMKKCKEL